MDVSIPGNPGRPGMTLNVPYCSDVTITIVELSAANYLNSTCTVDRLVLVQSLHRAASRVITDWHILHCAFDRSFLS